MNNLFKITNLKNHQNIIKATQLIQFLSMTQLKIVEKSSIDKTVKLI